MAKDGSGIPGDRIVLAGTLDDSAADIRQISAADKAAWDRFVLDHPDGTFFHLSGWQDVISGFLGHTCYYLLLERSGDIQGLLPLARVKSLLFGDALISLPFLVYGGPIGVDAEAVGQLIEEATKLADRLGVDYLELRNRKPVTDWPRKESYVTFRKTIESTADENLLAIPRKQRAVVRKAIKAGLTAIVSNSVEDLYPILTECKRNLGTPFFSRSYLECIAATFGESCEVLTVVNEGDVVSSVMSFQFRDEVLPYYGGGGMEARSVGANDFMYWKVMEKACLDGKKVFDYGRSQKGTGAYNFKKYWGFEAEVLSYEYYLVKAKAIPKLDPSNKRYQQAIRTWSKLPLPIARLLGPPVARLLG